MVFRLGITHKQLVKLVIRLPDIGDLFQTLDPMLGEPSNLVILQHTATRFTLQVVTPRIQNLLDHLIHVRILEDGETGTSAHRPVEDGVDWYTDEADGVAGVGPSGCDGEDMVEYGEEVVEVSDCRFLACRVGEVLLAVGDLRGKEMSTIVTCPMQPRRRDVPDQTCFQTA